MSVVSFLQARGVLIIRLANISAADMLIFTISVIGITYPGEPI